MISEEKLKAVIFEQNRKIKNIKQYNFLPREYMKDVQKLFKIPHSIIITGIRRCGKSVFLFEIIEKLKKGYYYINFEDDRLADFKLGDFDKLYEVCLENFGKNKIFFLDEVQNVIGWERWIRRMYDNGFKFFITGSNARLLSKELATLLTGRHLQFPIYPFSFKEFLNFKNFNFKKEDFYLAEKKVEIVKYISKYIKFGGFPEYLKYDQIEVLQGYFNDIIQRDIVERYNIKNIKQIKELARYLLTNISNLTTYNQLKKLTDIRSVNTVIKYFSYLENSYMVFKVPFFSYSIKKQIANPFKIYSVDVGLRNAISFRFSEDIGRIYENVVAIELKRRNKEIYYWKNKKHQEVDFLIREGMKIKQLIQVCYKIDDIKTKNRELKSLIECSKEIKCNNLLVITAGYQNEEKINSKKIKFISLWKWLLENN